MKWPPFADGIFKRIFVKKKKVCILVQFSLKFILQDPINCKATLVEVTVRCQIGAIYLTNDDTCTEMEL